MRYDFSPLFRSTVGFDHVGRVLDAALSAQDAVPGYPPYNIERTDQNSYRITMAVAGFGERDIKVTQQDNMLTVRAHRPDETAENVHFLHRGIASRGFDRSVRCCMVGNLERRPEHSEQREGFRLSAIE